MMERSVGTGPCLISQGWLTAPFMLLVKQPVCVYVCTYSNLSLHPSIYLLIHTSSLPPPTHLSFIHPYLHPPIIIYPPIHSSSHLSSTYSSPIHPSIHPVIHFSPQQPNLPTLSSFSGASCEVLWSWTACLCSFPRTSYQRDVL